MVARSRECLMSAGQDCAPFRIWCIATKAGAQADHDPPLASSLARRVGASQTRLDDEGMMGCADPDRGLQALVPTVFAFARVMLGEAEAARDIVQAAPAKAYDPALGGASMERGLAALTWRTRRRRALDRILESNAVAVCAASKKTQGRRQC